MRRVIVLASIMVLAGCSSRPGVRLHPGERTLLKRLVVCARWMPLNDALWMPDVERSFENAAEWALDADRPDLNRLLELAAHPIHARRPGLLDRALRAQAAERLVVDVGPGAMATSAQAAVHRLQAGVVSDLPWVGVLHDRLASFEASLPMPESARVGAPYKDRVVIADARTRGGTLREQGAITSRLPYDPALRQRLGTLYVIWRNIAQTRWFAPDVLPIARAVLVEDHHHLITARAHLSFYATRWLVMQLGPRPDREALGERYGPTVIARADVIGTLAQEWLVDQGVRPRAVSEENLAMLVAMAFVQAEEARRGDAPARHGAAAELVLDRLRADGAIRAVATGRWRIDFLALRRALRALAADLLALHAGSTGPSARLDRRIEGRVSRESQGGRSADGASDRAPGPVLRTRARPVGRGTLPVRDAGASVGTLGEDRPGPRDVGALQLHRLGRRDVRPAGRRLRAPDAGLRTRTRRPPARH